MCGCTSRDPAECECGVLGPCRCSCHRGYQGPKQPLDEKDAEIARLQARIARLEDAARVYLTNSTPVNAIHLDKALKGESKDE